MAHPNNPCSVRANSNIAGFLAPAKIQDATQRDIDLHIDVNVKGVIMGTQCTAKVMIEQGDGHIVNVASMTALATHPSGRGSSDSRKRIIPFFIVVLILVDDADCMLILECFTHFASLTVLLSPHWPTGRKGWSMVRQS